MAMFEQLKNVIKRNLIGTDMIAKQGYSGNVVAIKRKDRPIQHDFG